MRNFIKQSAVILLAAMMTFGMISTASFSMDIQVEDE